ncbi:MAG: class I SAM-dependent methyltransferase [Simkaniaceae bacterium]|nr:class I SAM-dependent methyltransferase [Simkaniaceae bacterium]
MTKRNQHLSLAHALWKSHLSKNDLVIDATAGNGHDSLFLSTLGVHLYVMDIQEKALQTTKERLAHYPHTHYFLQSHATFPSLPSPPKLIIYNLGYLPGGDKTVTTQTSSTLQSLEAATSLLLPGALITVMCYSGHAEGAKEEKELISFYSALKGWEVTHHRWLKHSHAPSLIKLKKNYDLPDIKEIDYTPI